MFRFFYRIENVKTFFIRKRRNFFKFIQAFFHLTRGTCLRFFCCSYSPLLSCRVLPANYSVISRDRLLTVTFSYNFSSVVPFYFFYNFFLSFIAPLWWWILGMMKNSVKEEKNNVLDKYLNCSHLRCKMAYFFRFVEGKMNFLWLSESIDPICGMNKK